MASVHTRYFVVLFAVLTVTLAQKSIDFDAMMKNDRLLNYYFNCVMDRGSCSPEAIQLKKRLPEAILTGCGKCNDKQKEQMTTILTYFKKNHGKSFTELKAKIHPEAKYWDQIKDEPGA